MTGTAEVDRPALAAFDFDGTLTYRDSLFPFLRHAVGGVMFTRHMFALAPTLAGYALGLIRNDLAKERVFTRFFADAAIADLDRLGEQFAARILPGMIRPDAEKRLDWHRRQGHRCVLISASLELYVRPWALAAGFDEVIASRLETCANGRVTGKLSGRNCFGPEKLRRLEALYGSGGNYTLYAYGDSRGDAELLAAADHPYFRCFS